MLRDEVDLLLDSHDSILLSHCLILCFYELVQDFIRLVRGGVQESSEPSVNLVVYLRLPLVRQIREVL